MMAARLLSDAGLDVTTLLLGAPNKLTGDAAEAWLELASPAHGLIHIVATAEDLARHKSALEADLIVDALVGTGFKPPLKGLALAALDWLKASHTPVWLPSSRSTFLRLASRRHHCRRGRPSLPRRRRHYLTSPKPAHVFGQLTRHWDQPIVVASIGSPEAAIVLPAKTALAGSALALTQLPAQPRPTKAILATCWSWAARSEQRAESRAHRPWPLWPRCEPVRPGHSGRSSPGPAAV